MKVLIAEDDAVSRHVIKANLEKWGYQVIETRDGGEAWKILSSDDAPNLALLDWVMPEIDGIEVCRRIRAMGREPYIYVILLTAKAQKEEMIEGLECGADDYVVKPFHPHELRVRLRAGERIVALQQQLIDAREKLRELATRDTLTGILNRGAVYDLLRQELERGVRGKTPVHICMLDIDHFKRINDTLGHPAGDEVLRETAARIRHALRAYDTVGRYGGEEFLVILPGGTSESAHAVAERIRICINDSPVRVQENEVAITASLGLASVEMPTSVEPDTLLKEADLALYEAKHSGRDCLVQRWLEHPAHPEA